MRIRADVLETYDSCRVNHHVAAQLVPIPARFSRPTAAHHQLQVSQDRQGSVQIPPAAASHAVGLVNLLIGIQEQRPGQIAFLDISFCHSLVVKSDDFHIDVVLDQFRFLLTQLRQMFTTRRSAQVAMEEQNQPASSTILKPVFSAVSIWQFERYRVLIGLVHHSNFSRVGSRLRNDCSSDAQFGNGKSVRFLRPLSKGLFETNAGCTEPKTSERVNTQRLF